MDKDINLLRAINEAIWLRDHADSIDRAKLFEVIEDIGEYGLFSARQISSLSGSAASHQMVARLCKKTDKTGGRLSPATLEGIKQCFHDRINKTVDYKLVKEIIDAGTSQGMLSKMTGINQGQISKELTKLNGSIHHQGKVY